MRLFGRCFLTLFLSEKLPETSVLCLSVCAGETSLNRGLCGFALGAAAPTLSPAYCPRFRSGRVRRSETRRWNAGRCLPHVVPGALLARPTVFAAAWERGTGAQVLRRLGGVGIVVVRTPIGLGLGGRGSGSSRGSGGGGDVCQRSIRGGKAQRKRQTAAGGRRWRTGRRIGGSKTTHKQPVRRAGAGADDGLPAAGGERPARRARGGGKDRQPGQYPAADGLLLQPGGVPGCPRANGRRRQRSPGTVRRRINREEGNTKLNPVSRNQLNSFTNQFSAGNMYVCTSM